MNEFTFCIGHPWEEDEPENVAVYAYGSETFYGDLEYANQMRDFIQERSGEKKKYNIYKLVKI